MIIDKLKDYLAQAKISGLIGDIEFPCSKEDIMVFAEDHNAPDKVIELLDRLPDQLFNSVMEVIAGLRGSKGGE